MLAQDGFTHRELDQMAVRGQKAELDAQTGTNPSKIDSVWSVGSFGSAVAPVIGSVLIEKAEASEHTSDLVQMQQLIFGTPQNDLQISALQIYSKVQIIDFRSAGTLTGTTMPRRAPAPNAIPKPAGEIAIVTQVLLKVAGEWGLSFAEIANLLGLDDSREVAELEAGTKSLISHDAQHRMGVVIGMAEAIDGFLRTTAEQVAWLKQPRTGLAGKSVWDLLTGKSIEELLAARDFVYDFAGR